MLQYLRVGKRAAKTGPDPIELSLGSLTASPASPISLRSLNKLHGNIKQRIVAEVERRLSVAEEGEAALTANLHRAQRLRQSILKQAFAGRLAAQDPVVESASALLERIRAERAKAEVKEKPRKKKRR